MKITLTQNTKVHDANRLHDFFISESQRQGISSLAPLLVQSTATETYLEFDDAVGAASVQAVLAAYVYVEPQPVKTIDELIEEAVESLPPDQTMRDAIRRLAEGLKGRA
jgi:hypothetical protein